ncbi:MAG: PD-(D/E)XK nuclease family protein, partial [bacterium]|nr:PD-(D/E)XK nuclease family protein [bacterium]
IVFIFAGISKERNEDYYKFYDEQLDRTIYDLTKDEKNKNRFEEERRKEDERLYYVALTRAIARLYIPYIPDNKKNKSTFIELINKNIKFLIESKKVNILDVKKVLETVKFNNKETKILSIPCDFLKPLNIKLLKDEIFSFSSLTLKKDKNNEFSIPEIDYSIKEDDENTAYPIKKEENLPGSVEVGLIFHEIMEEISFEKVDEELNNFKNNPEINALIENKIKKFIPYSYKIKEEKVEPIKQELINIIHCTLNKNLGDNIVLRKISEKNMIKEVQFYYILEREKQNYYINGIIDLLFKHNDKYYLLDWKTNKLDSYDKEKIKIEMEDKSYLLQLKIYLISIIKWLSKRIPDFNYEKNFGGIFYLFVRGINEKNNDGIFFYKPPSISCIDEYLAELKKLSLIKGEIFDSNIRYY